jgi:hypothetical protein
MLAVSKLNTINDLISKALNDSHISTDEFTLITKENYITMKNYIIRKKQREKNLNIDVDQLKNTFLEGKKLAQSEIIMGHQIYLYQFITFSSTRLLLIKWVLMILLLIIENAKKLLLIII